MPFNTYQSASDVAHRHRLTWRREKLVGEAPFALSLHLREELAFSMESRAYDRSETGACETLIFPLLREVWRPYHRDLSLWSHEPIVYDDDLCGVPDYLVSRRSPLGPFVPDQPFLLVVEAKRDDYFKGWGQCLAAMRGAQKLAADPALVFYGASTNGRSWEFGRLQGDEFVQDRRQFSVQDLDGLAAALRDVVLRYRDPAAGLLVTA